MLVDNYYCNMPPKPPARLTLRSPWVIEFWGGVQMKSQKKVLGPSDIPASTATLAAGIFLCGRRENLGWSMRRTGRELGISFSAWRNIELGIKPPGRATLLKVLYNIGLTEVERKTITRVYYEHDVLGGITNITAAELFGSLLNAEE